MEALSTLLDNKLGPLQSEVKAMRTSVDKQRQATNALSSRMSNTEYGLNWCYWKLQTIENATKEAAITAVKSSVETELAAAAM